MNTISRKPTFTNTTISILVFLFLVSYTHFFSSSSCSSALWTTLLALAGLSLAAVCLAVVARTTMVAWITVLVLLTFKGKRRHVLAHQGKKITADVAMDLIKVLLMERRFVTVICATAVSIMAMAQITRF